MSRSTSLLALPLAPLRAVTRIAGRVRLAAVRQWSDPLVLHAQSKDVQALRDAGAIDAAAADRLDGGRPS